MDIKPTQLMKQFLIFFLPEKKGWGVGGGGEEWVERENGERGGGDDVNFEKS